MNSQNDTDRRHYLVTIAKAGIAQTKVVLNALWAVTPEKKERNKITYALTALDEALRHINTLYNGKDEVSIIDDCYWQEAIPEEREGIFTTGADGTVESYFDGYKWHNVH